MLIELSLRGYEMECYPIYPDSISINIHYLHMNSILLHIIIARMVKFRWISLCLPFHPIAHISGAHPFPCG